MKVAFWPGCVSKGACPELYVSTKAIAEPLGLELRELESAPCTGAGVLSEQNPPLADALNGLTLAMAESEGASLMTICSTCQGVLSQHNYYLKNDKERMERANATLAPRASPIAAPRRSSTCFGCSSRTSASTASPPQSSAS